MGGRAETGKEDIKEAFLKIRTQPLFPTWLSLHIGPL